VDFDALDRRGLADALQERTSRPHDVIPYTARGVTDTWDALKVLDRDPAASNKVRLIYGESAIDTDRTINRYEDGWNREHLWPRSYGVGKWGPDFSDLHCLRASGGLENAARGNEPFGRFMPPASVRGDIARCMFYMAVRYDGLQEGTEDLELTNCPCSARFAMGHLGTLLQWHAEDPVDDVEAARNARICGDYQHNRNPFVDHPELVGRLWDRAHDAVCATGNNTGCRACHGGQGKECEEVDEEAEAAQALFAVLPTNVGAGRAVMWLLSSVCASGVMGGLVGVARRHNLHVASKLTQHEQFSPMSTDDPP